MWRVMVGLVAVLGLVLSTASAQDNKNQGKFGAKQKPVKAKIVKVDPKKQTITVEMKDKSGKQVEKTFKLTEDIRMLDETGKVVAIDVFQSGNDILVVEREGKLVEMRRNKGGKGFDRSRPEK
jgi:uncharacterized protein YuzE